MGKCALLIHSQMFPYPDFLRMVVLEAKMLILLTAIVLQQNKFIPFVKVFWLESAKKSKREEKKLLCPPFLTTFSLDQGVKLK